MKPSPKKNTSPKKGPPQKTYHSTAKKKNVQEVTYKKEVIAMFMQWFRKNAPKKGAIMGKIDVVRNILVKLDMKQEEALEEAMQDLVDNGWIAKESDGVTLVLTQKGFEYIKKS
jgi:hypothetical protein